MTADNSAKLEALVEEQFGISLEELLAPISTEVPVGKYLRGNGVYAAIREARREDDPTLPLGPWAYELKAADWDKVSDVALNAIAYKSKDLQVAVWLLEAQINLYGFAAIAPCMVLMRALCDHYWDELYPQIEDGDLEYRTNIIAWANEKLLPRLRTLPISASGRGREYTWADWEQARRNEQIRLVHGRQSEDQLEGATSHELMAAMAATSTEAHSALYKTLANALESIEELDAVLTEHCGDEAPTLNAMAGLLEQVQAMVASDLHKRGVRLAAVGKGAAEAGDAGGGSAEGGGGGGDQGGGPAGGGGEGDGGPIRDRAHAYARLGEAADYLMHIEPHSPAPYLVQRAIEWGNLNTAELYHELFVRFGGQLNIFELLGLQDESSAN